MDLGLGLGREVALDVDLPTASPSAPLVASMPRCQRGRCRSADERLAVEGEALVDESLRQEAGAASSMAWKVSQSFHASSGALPTSAERPVTALGCQTMNAGASAAGRLEQRGPVEPRRLRCKRLARPHCGGVTSSDSTRVACTAAIFISSATIARRAAARRRCPTGRAGRDVRPYSLRISAIFGRREGSSRDRACRARPAAGRACCATGHSALRDPEAEEVRGVEVGRVQGVDVGADGAADGAVASARRSAMAAIGGELRLERLRPFASMAPRP